MSNEGLYRTYRTVLRERFGQPVLRVPVGAGFSCPNRDGTLSTEGCSFCENRAFSPAASPMEPPLAQLYRAVRGAGNRYALYIAYFQPYTNTYGPLQRLRSAYEPLLEVAGVVGLALGTRPDCLPVETLDYLSDLSKRTYLCVELGLQSASDAVLRANNRGHGYGDFVNAAESLAERGIETAVHVVLGLRGDTPEGALETARCVARLPVSGVKVHQLMVIEGTMVERWYRGGELSLMSAEEYAGLVGEFLALLRPDQCVHRLVAEARPVDGLVAPLWSTQKARVLDAIHEYMLANRIRQGCRYRA